MEKHKAVVGMGVGIRTLASRYTSHRVSDKLKNDPDSLLKTQHGATTLHKFQGLGCFSLPWLSTVFSMSVVVGTLRNFYLESNYSYIYLCVSSTVVIRVFKITNWSP